MVNENEPVKCPECSTWWRGLTHKCAPVTTTKVTTSSSTPKVRDKACPECGIEGLHGCTGKPYKTDYTCHWCGQQTDWTQPHNCLNPNPNRTRK